MVNNFKGFYLAFCLELKLVGYKVYITWISSCESTCKMRTQTREATLYNEDHSK